MATRALVRKHGDAELACAAGAAGVALGQPARPLCVVGRTHASLPHQSALTGPWGPRPSDTWLLLLQMCVRVCQTATCLSTRSAPRPRICSLACRRTTGISMAVRLPWPRSTRTDCRPHNGTESFTHTLPCTFSTKLLVFLWFVRHIHIQHSMMNQERTSFQPCQPCLRVGNQSWIITCKLDEQHCML